jgi:hypothetical protein
VLIQIDNIGGIRRLASRESIFESGFQKPNTLVYSTQRPGLYFSSVIPATCSHALVSPGFLGLQVR